MWSRSRKKIKERREGNNEIKLWLSTLFKLATFLLRNLMITWLGFHYMLHISSRSLQYFLLVKFVNFTKIYLDVFVSLLGLISIFHSFRNSLVLSFNRNLVSYLPIDIDYFVSPLLIEFIVLGGWLPFSHILFLSFNTLLEFLPSNSLRGESTRLSPFVMLFIEGFILFIVFLTPSISRQYFQSFNLRWSTSFAPAFPVISLTLHSSLEWIWCLSLFFIVSEDWLYIKYLRPCC